MKFILLVSAAFSLLAMGYGEESKLSVDPDQVPVVFADLEDWLNDLLQRAEQLRTMVVKAETLPSNTPEENLVLKKAKKALDPGLLLGKVEAHLLSSSQKLASLFPTEVGTCSFNDQEFSCITLEDRN